MSAAPQAVPDFRPVPHADPAVVVERRPDGSMILRSPHPLGAHPTTVLHWLHHWAAATPERTMLAERDRSGTWQHWSYARVLSAARSIGQALLDRGLDQSTSVMILSGNSIEHALMTLGAMLVGVPVAPVSPAYTLMSSDCHKVRHVFDLVDPRLVLVQNGRQFARAFAVLPVERLEIVAVEDPAEGVRSTPFAELLATPVTAAVDTAHAALTSDTIAKYLFTSGSTGMPKGVVNTHGMLAANQQMADQVLPGEEGQVVLEWLPWNHTMGGNYAFHRNMRLGGSLYIDHGRPVPGLFDETLRNLREISPTGFTNVPVGYSMLVPALNADDDLRRSFFKDLKILGYGGANLPFDLFQAMQDLAVRTTGQRVMFMNGWGSTETAPTATLQHWPIERPGVIGLPFPGVEIKMVPNGGKFELRIKGPIVFPGYVKRPDLTSEAFDEEGFYKIGDAGRFLDPGDPTRGLVYDGRVTEDFKLETGTWVHVGGLRIGVLDACTPVLLDAVVCGHDRSHVALLAWPNIPQCRALAVGLPADAPVEALIAAPEVVARVRAGLERWNAANPGSSHRVRRLMLMAEPPQPDGSEITDKGYINQRATRERRAGLVERLFLDPPGPDIIEV